MKPIFKNIPAILALAAVYFMTAKFGLSLAFVNASSTAVWPPTGIALAALILWGYRRWPGIFLGAFLVNLTTQGTWATTLGIATGNTLEALLGAWAVNQFANGRNFFEQARDIFRFIVLVVIASTLVSATFGTTSLALGGFAQRKDFMPVWTTWWFGDAIGALIVTPLILIWSKVSVSRWSRRRLIEAIAIFSTMLLVSLSAFSSELNTPLSRYIRFLLYPMALWAAFRFGQRGAINSVFTVACVSIWGTLKGFGPFVQKTPHESILFLQAYLGAFAVTNLILGSVISERQRAEEILRESENRMRLILDTALDAVVIIDAHAYITDWNPQAERIFGCAKSEVLGKKLSEIIFPPRHREALEQGLRNYFDTGASPLLNKRTELVAVRSSGREFPMELAITPMNVKDQIHFSVFIRDITQRKLDERQIQKLNADLEHRVKEFRTLIDTSPVGIAVAADAQCEQIWCNAEFSRMLGTEPRQNISKSAAGADNLPFKVFRDGREIPADDLPMQRACREGKEVLNQELEFNLPNGKIVHELCNAIPLWDEAGKVCGCIGVFLDISQRKAAERSLRESEDRFRTLASHAPVGIFMSNPNGDSIYVNECWCAMTGLKPAEAQGKDWIKAVHPDDRERIIAGWSEAVSRSDSSNVEFRFMRPDGVVTWVYGTAIQIRNPGGELAGYIGTVVDITERKLAETALHQAKDELARSNEWLEKRVRERTVDLIQANSALEAEIVARKQAELVHTQLAAIVEFSSDAILSKTPEGIITSWNRGAQRMFGYAAEEIIGRSVSQLIPPDRADEMNLLLEGLLSREELIESFETVRLRKDGKPVYVSLTISSIRDETGRVTGVSSIMQDISERKRLEAEILQVSEREQRRIAEDLHDGLGQQLGGISCLSDVLKKNLAEQASPEAEAAAKISRLLTVAMAQTRSLARGLHPVAPEANGLMSALEDLAARVTDLFKVTCEFECPETVLVEDNTMATHLYRIAQEAVTNALKHGRAQRIKIGLFSTPERVILEVDDDGIGLRSERHSKGLGLRIMNHRAGMIGGHFVVQKKSDGGSVAICTVQIQNGQASKK